MVIMLTYLTYHQGAASRGDTRGNIFGLPMGGVNVTTTVISHIYIYIYVYVYIYIYDNNILNIHCTQYKLTITAC